MLLPDDAGLVAADPDLPGLGHVLDVGALLDRLPFPAGSDTTPVGGAAEYVRYKPGSSVVAGLRLQTTSGEVRAYAAAWAAGGAAKVAKAQDFGAQDPYGFGVAVDESLHLVLGAATADRELPGLRAMLRRPSRILPRSHAGEPVHPVRYKPGRRWVGVAEHRGDPSMLVKVHRPRTTGRHVAASRSLAEAGLPVPVPVKWKGRHGLVSYRFVVGNALDEAGADPDTLHATGRLLADLHRAAPWPGAVDFAVEVAADLAAAARAVAAVRPTMAPLAASVADHATAALTADPARARRVVHGDFSADQVLRHDAGLALLDLDRAGCGFPEDDLATWVAAETAAGRAGPATAPPEVLGELLEGYLAAAGRARPDRLAPHVAAALLRRAAEPFRSRQPSWGAAVDRLVHAAARHVGVAA